MNSASRVEQQIKNVEKNVERQLDALWAKIESRLNLIETKFDGQIGIVKAEINARPKLWQLIGALSAIMITVVVCVIGAFFAIDSRSVPEIRVVTVPVESASELAPTAIENPAAAQDD